MKRITRDRHLTSEEATRYDAIREEIDQEKPEISDRIRKRLSERKTSVDSGAGVGSLSENGFDNLDTVADWLGVAVSELLGVTVLVLPENVRTAESRVKMYDAEDSIFLAKTLKRGGVACKTAYDLGVRPKIMDRRGADIWLGVIWLFLEDDGFPLAVNVISEWLKARFLLSKKEAVSTSAEAPATIHVELRVQQKKQASTFKYTGPASHLVKVLSGLKELSENKDE
jgi:hypothetical protein